MVVTIMGEVEFALAPFLLQGTAVVLDAGLVCSRAWPSDIEGVSTFHAMSFVVVLACTIDASPDPHRQVLLGTTWSRARLL